MHMPSLDYAETLAQPPSTQLNTDHRCLMDSWLNAGQMELSWTSMRSRTTASSKQDFE
jgi:hypothetical protein